MGKGEIKAHSFANDMILHIKDRKDSTRHSLKLINTSSRVPGN